MLNLDTHILLHAIAGEVTSKERKLLDGQEWSISAIVLWEIAKLAQLGRIEFDLDSPELMRLLSRIHTWPITLDICREIRSLDFHSDPPTKSSLRQASFIACRSSRATRKSGKAK